MKYFVIPFIFFVGWIAIAGIAPSLTFWQSAFVMMIGVVAALLAAAIQSD